MMPAVLLIALLSLAGVTSFKVHEAFKYELPEAQSQDIMNRLMGSAQEMVGDAMFTKADAYFHGGLYKQKDFLGEPRSEKAEGHEEEAHHHDEEGHAPSEEGGAPNWIRWIDRQIQATEHRHLEGVDEEVEMLPFLALASRLNPNNLSAIATEAYWLEGRLGRVDEGIEVLVRGIRMNPEAWQLDYQLGMIYYMRKEDYARSAAVFKESIRKARGRERDMGVQDSGAFELAHYLAADSLDRLGLSGEALEFYRQCLAFFGPGSEVPLKGKIEARVRELASSGEGARYFREVE
ncbi:MAG: hypothetical protein HYY14_03375 [Candidatus Omnitrophica bacterium]|nr:hypothetical protein [Candidatus Omnitrophota bacterium]